MTGGDWQAVGHVRSHVALRVDAWLSANTALVHGHVLLATQAQCVIRALCTAQRAAHSVELPRSHSTVTCIIIELMHGVY